MNQINNLNLTKHQKQELNQTYSKWLKFTKLHQNLTPTEQIQQFKTKYGSELTSNLLMYFLLTDDNTAQDVFWSLINSKKN